MQKTFLISVVKATKKKGKLMSISFIVFAFCHIMYLIFTFWKFEKHMLIWRVHPNQINGIGLKDIHNLFYKRLKCLKHWWPLSTKSFQGKIKEHSEKETITYTFVTLSVIELDLYDIHLLNVSIFVFNNWSDCLKNIHRFLWRR